MSFEEINKEEEEKSRFEQIAAIIANSSTAIEREYADTANDWLECLGSRIFQLECYVSSDKAQQELGEDLFRNIQQKLEHLKARKNEVRKMYPDKSATLSEDIKKELLQLFNVL